MDELWRAVPADGRNPFRDAYADRPDEAWAAALLRSVDEAIVDGLAFPPYPDPAIQDGMHGNHGRIAIDEAQAFHRFIRAHGAAAPGRLLDFGCGWGRCLRPFMRDFPLEHLWGFEPHAPSAALARTLNPFVTVLSGSAVPEGQIPGCFFQTAIAWSVFSHLSPTSAASWLRDLARAIVPGGTLVFTTWGERFLRRLEQEAMERSKGRDIHWYSAVCLDVAGPIATRLAEFGRGEFVWFTSGLSTLYGEAFMSKAALVRLIRRDRLPFTIEVADTSSLSQDVFILRRS